MCIIVAKSKKASLPRKKTLKTCFENNPDGCGLMYVNHNKEVVIDKGYMTFDSFYKHFQKLKKEYNNFDNKSLVIHFRIGTGGTNTDINTHPYPISNKIEDLHALYKTTDIGVAHNGIISKYNYKIKDVDMNDTQYFIMSYLYKIKKYIPEFYKDYDIMLGIEELCGSKLCFLNNDEELYFVGNFIDEDNGVKYSNSTYEENRYTYGYYRDYGYGYYSHNLSYNDVKNVSNSYTELKKNWTIVYKDGIVEEIDEDNLYFADKEGTLYMKDEVSDDFYEIEYDIRVYDQNGKKVRL